MQAIANLVATEQSWASLPVHASAFEASTNRSASWIVVRSAPQINTRNTKYIYVRVPVDTQDLVEAHRQSLAVANSPMEEEDQDFIDSISVWGDE